MSVGCCRRAETHARAEGRRAGFSGLRVGKPQPVRQCECMRRALRDRARHRSANCWSAFVSTVHAHAPPGRCAFDVDLPLVLHAANRYRLEFPVLGKYRLLRRRFAPFVGFGPTFRRVGFKGQNITIDLSGPASPGQVVTSVSDVHGRPLAAWTGAGRRRGVPKPFVRFSPELRYSHRPSGKACNECGPFTLPVPRSSSTVLLLGVGF
jgi:hypothetical protein